VGEERDTLGTVIMVCVCVCVRERGAQHLKDCPHNSNCLFETFNMQPIEYWSLKTPRPK